MKALMKLAFPAVALAIAVIQAPPARAFDMGQMEQFAPVLEVMKQRMSKRQFQQMVQMGAAMMPLMERSGFNLGDIGAMGPGMDVGNMTSMVQSLGGMQSLTGLIPRKVRKAR
jgi:hypothetical protein